MAAFIDIPPAFEGNSGSSLGKYLTTLAIAGCSYAHTKQLPESLRDSSSILCSHRSVEYSLIPLSKEGSLMLCFGGLNGILDSFSITPGILRTSRYGTLNPNIVLAVQDLPLPIEHIKIIAGYSLGGAYAVYTAILNQLAVPVITFGSPRCVGLDARILLDLDITRYCIKGDPVVHSPLVGGWYHIGKPKVLDRVNGKWEILGEQQCWQDCLNELSFGNYYSSLFAVIYLVLKSLVDRNFTHSLGTYEEAINQICS